MIMPRILIIILNWNGWKDTIECLESVFRNSYPNYQVAVIDNASPDDSMNNIKQWAEGTREPLCIKKDHPLYHLSHPYIKKPVPYLYYTLKEPHDGGILVLEEENLYFMQKEGEKTKNFNSRSCSRTVAYTNQPLILIQTSDNLGFAAGNNVGIKYALKRDFDYVLLLNNDTVVDKMFLIYLVRTAMKDTKYGILGPTVLYYKTPNIINFAGGKINFWHGNSPHFNVGKVYDEHHECEKNITFAEGSCLLIKKDLVKLIGFFDVDYFLYYEDTDFCARAINAGYKILHVSRSKVWHKISASSCLLASQINIYFSIRNRIYFMRKNAKIYHLLTFSPSLAIIILRILIKFIIMKRQIPTKYLHWLVRAVRDGMTLPLRPDTRRNRSMTPMDSMPRSEQ